MELAGAKGLQQGVHAIFDTGGAQGPALLLRARVTGNIEFWLAVVQVRCYGAPLFPIGMVELNPQPPLHLRHRLS